MLQGFSDTIGGFYEKQLKDIGDIKKVVGFSSCSRIDINQIGKTAIDKDTLLIICKDKPSAEGAGKYSTKNILEITVPNRVKAHETIFNIAAFFDAPLLLIDTDRIEKESLKHVFLASKTLLMKIFHGYDLAIGNLTFFPLEESLADFLISPLITSLYGYRIFDPLSSVLALSADLIQKVRKDIKDTPYKPTDLGINPWILLVALREGVNICQIDIEGEKKPLDNNSFLYFLSIVESVFEKIIIDKKVLSKENISKSVDYFGTFTDKISSFDTFLVGENVFFKGQWPKEIIEKLDLLEKQDLSFLLTSWVQIVYETLEIYDGKSSKEKADLLEFLYFAYNKFGKSVLKSFRDILGNVENKKLMKALWDKILEDNIGEFMRQKTNFIKKLKTYPKETSSITPLDYLELIPGVPIVLPKWLEGKNKEKIKTSDIFKSLQKRYEQEFRSFLRYIKIKDITSSKEIVEGMTMFIEELEKTIDNLFPGNIHSEEGLEQFVSRIYSLFPNNEIMAVKWEVLKKLIYEYPPWNLMLRMGFRSIREMFSSLDEREILTLSSFTEDRDYFDKIFFWLKDNLRSDSFEMDSLRPIIVNRYNFPIIGLREITELNRLTMRIGITNIGKGQGGLYPKLRYFTLITKSIVEAEHFSHIWGIYAKENKEVGRRYVNSLQGHYGKAMFSAHHIFENWHHRELVTRLKKMAHNLQKDSPIASYYISAMAKGYGLSLVLDDGTFIPCSPWTWASFSFKGGEGVPTPFFVKIERDWFNHDLLEEICRQTNYNVDDIMNQVFCFISQGRESIDLAKVMLGIKPFKEEVVIQELENWPKAKPLVRYSDNPILSPIKGHWWESKYVLNAAAFRICDKVYILYRAFGNDKISRIGLAITDGYKVIERLNKPIFSPETEHEKMGCEDPRVVLIDDEIFMLYTAYDGVVAQIATASIKVEDFIGRRFDKWQRRGLAFPGLWDKDAILFPEKIDGKYVMYHRIEPSMWIAYSNELRFPWPENGHKIIMGPRSGLMWDSLKIGAGAQPIKTEFGWLLIYHGVDRQMFYRLGVMLVDLKDPGRILYRSPNAILSPQTSYEIGEEGKTWVPNVVFTCGAVAANEREILRVDDEILVYYGAADAYVCLATGKVGDLIPKQVRQKIKS